MSKYQMVEAIRERNQSASQEFLLTFDEQTLRAYLHRLTDVLGHRGRQSVWVRQSTSRAVVTRPQA